MRLLNLLFMKQQVAQCRKLFRTCDKFVNDIVKYSQYNKLLGTCIKWSSNNHMGISYNCLKHDINNRNLWESL
jgi:hypothetical protein